MPKMPDIPIFEGTSSFSPGDTPFGYYDDDPEFQQNADKVAIYCARRLGYPIVDIELQPKNFYAAFEEAITTYGNEVYAYKVRQDYLSLEGSPTGSTVNNSLVTPNLSTIIRISKQYGSEAGSGGTVDWRRGRIELEKGVQDYDLEQWSIENGNPPGEFELKKVFYQDIPASLRSQGNYVGYEANMVMDSFGFSGGSPAAHSSMIMPVNFSLAQIQSIELNQNVRRSHFSFEVKNNKLRILPIPKKDGYLHFQYILKSDRTSNTITPNSENITDVSNVPFNNPVYSEINSVGKSWIREYTLAICKEILGYVRGKYQNIPIPDDEVTLNHGDLIASATSDKEKLIDRLREYLGETSREKLMERRSSETEFRRKELAEIPTLIYVR